MGVHRGTGTSLGRQWRRPGPAVRRTAIVDRIGLRVRRVDRRFARRFPVRAVRSQDVPALAGLANDSRMAGLFAQAEQRELPNLT